MHCNKCYYVCISYYVCIIDASIKHDSISRCMSLLPRRVVMNGNCAYSCLVGIIFCWIGIPIVDLDDDNSSRPHRCCNTGTISGRQSNICDTSNNNLLC